MDDVAFDPSSNFDKYSKINKPKNVPDVSPKKINSPEFIIAAGSKQ